MLHEQLSPSPWFAAPHPIWQPAAQALGVPPPPSVSIVREQPFFALGPSLAALLALWLGVILGTHRAIARRLLWVVAASGALYALYGILSTLIEPNNLLFHKRESFAGYVTGTFVNRNTAAAYFGACAVIWQLLLTERFCQSPPYKFPGRISWNQIAALANQRDIIFAFSGFFLCLMALFMTGSRAGIVVSLGVLGAGTAAYIIRDRRGRRELVLRLAAVAGVILCLYVFFGGALDARFAMDGFRDGGRSAAYAATLRLIGELPWFGSGLGTFEWAFPHFRSDDSSMWGIWDLAHSTPLELAADLGIPFTLLIGLGWIAILWILARGAFIRRRDAVIPLAGFCVALIGLLHSMVDFSLQVPGFTIVAMAVAGVGIAQAFPSPDRLGSQDS